MKRCSQTFKSLPQRMSKMDDFSFVGVNATLRNKHAHAREAKENEFHSNYWPRSFLVVSIVWNQRPKGKCGDMVQLELADLGFSILEVVSHHLHHLHHPCHLQARDCVSAAWTGRTPSRRQRTPFSGNGIGRVRRMRQDYVQSARCHGIKQGRTSLQAFCCRLRAASSRAAAFQS